MDLYTCEGMCFGVGLAVASEACKESYGLNWIDWSGRSELDWIESNGSERRLREHAVLVRVIPCHDACPEDVWGVQSL